MENIKSKSNMNSEIKFDNKKNLNEDDLNYKIISLHFVVEIIDNGIGIKQENIPKLFMEFNKLDE